MFSLSQRLLLANILGGKPREFDLLRFENLEFAVIFLAGVCTDSIHRLGHHRARSENPRRVRYFSAHIPFTLSSHLRIGEIKLTFLIYKCLLRSSRVTSATRMPQQEE
mmetsp:Transcript_49123/g.79240  ORF Transcript_49123/g.79240 Transcript_49123/m.79240 type:complete len:108 (+) Transcript_49123:1155-1478(+)